MADEDRPASKVRAFTDLVVWQKSHQLFLAIVDDVEGFPKKRAAWVISDQILRSSASISSNISEGFGRKTRADYEHFLIIARGSTTETQSWLIKCKDLGYITRQTFALRDGVCREIIKMLNSLIGSLRRK
jgi:four helix bundle protein